MYEKMMNWLKWHVLLTSIIFLADPQGLCAEPLRVLFAGNSYTYVNELPQVVAYLACAKKVPLVAYAETQGGVSLEDHWYGRKGLKTVQTISEHSFDFVVLQDQSMRPIVEPDKTIEYAQRLCKKTIETGAKPVLFLTWARKAKPKTQTSLNKTYRLAARKGHALIAPVGAAWQTARELRPDIPLYSKDGSHPSTIGTYLSACVFFAVLTNRPPKDLPNTWVITDNQRIQRTMQIKRIDAKFCQDVATLTLKAFAADSGIQKNRKN